MPKIGIIKLVAIFTFSLLMLIPTMSSSYGTFGTDVLHLQIVYVTDQNQCRISDLQNVQEFDELVKKYFELYELDSFNYEPSCMTMDQFSSYRTPYYFDLLILIIDQDFRQQTLAEKGLEGLYAHLGADRSTNHFILLNDRPDFESDLDSKNPSWVLTNSLSHLILYYKGYDPHVIERFVQPTHPHYKDCFGKGFISASCAEVKQIIRAENVGKDFVILTPFEGAVGNNLIHYIGEEISESDVSKNLHKQITKWWLSGKLSDDDYLDAIKLVARIPSYSIETFHLNPLEIDGGFAIPVFSFEKERDKTINSSFREAIQNELSLIENLIPFDAKDTPKIVQNGKFPDWFKERASLWVNGQLSDFIFLDGLEGLLRSKNIIP